ncbi:unnamed protein product [Blepharisma stoltei]|uniref:Coatomer subunit zeta n=1 Tax=Blepharisma stoltei TaxID=1481888 RepID=A0AAU9JIX4_9CILI|nr:unnamed protein product [Blepharisma stoltei]
MICQMKGIIVLDNEGQNIFSKYYNPSSSLLTHSNQKLFEQQLYSKSSRISTRGTEADIFMLETYSVVFKNYNDIAIYLFATFEENEILMASLLDAITEALEMLYRTEIDKKRVCEEMDLMMLAIDEFLDDGIIICCDAMSIVERVTMREGQQVLPQKNKKQESTLGRAITNARQAISKSLMR